MSGKPYFGLLLANFGHLYSVLLLGLGLYWKFWAWDAVGWGNFGFVYLGAATRISFGLGLDHVGGKSRRSVIQLKAAYITLTSAWMASDDLYAILIQRQAPYNKINHQPTFTQINSQRDVVELDKANRTQQK